MCIGTILVFLFFILFALPGLAKATFGQLPRVAASSTPTTTIRATIPGVDIINNTTLAQANDSNHGQLLYSAVVYSTSPADIISITPANSSPATATPSPSAPDSAVPSPQPTEVFYFPILSKDHFVPTPTATPTPSPPETVLYCDSLPGSLSIPDDDPNGVDDQIAILDGRIVTSLNLYLNISHTWVGDLVVTLTDPNTGATVTSLNRPRMPGSETGCLFDNIVTVLDDKAAQPVDGQCASYPAAISGIYQPYQQLAAFIGKSISGTWKLNVSDRYPNDTGELNHWCLEAAIADTLPPPTPSPTPVNLPDSAYLYGLYGQDQQFTLDCESRSAVDWATYFGYDINELQFLDNLPRSDDPEVGFVGDPQGVWGSIPPDDYGVHAPPVAALLRDYGLTASSYRTLQWDDLRAEIASGHPAIVWIIGGVSRNLVNGIPHYYTAPSTGNTTIVAPGEHTVILVGYTPDSVTVLNGERFVDVPLDQFLDSWSVLDFMAVLSRP